MSVRLESRSIFRSSRELYYKRVNWRTTARALVWTEFERLSAEAIKFSYAFKLRVHEEDTPNEGTIQITADAVVTGAVNRQSSFDFNTGKSVFDDTPVMETGGALVASQSVTGLIHFVVYPRKSERVQPTYKEIILFRPLDPADVNKKVIRKAIRSFLFVLRVTSLAGGHSPSLADRARLVLMRARDLRYKHELARSIISMRNEWGKIIGAAVAGAMLTYAASSLTESKSARHGGKECVPCLSPSTHSRAAPLTGNVLPPVRYAPE